MTISGRREPCETIANAMGFVRKIVFLPLTPGAP
jgi:hypothetical protein